MARLVASLSDASRSKKKESRTSLVSPAGRGDVGGWDGTAVSRAKAREARKKSRDAFYRFKGEKERHLLVLGEL